MNSGSANRILWVDCVGGLLVGGLVLALHRPISVWENLPVAVVVGMAAANLAYGCYSLFVTVQSPRRKKLVEVLAIANIIWLVVCLGILWAHWDSISLLGVAHVAGEGVYVAGLGIVEWKLREKLAHLQSEQ